MSDGHIARASATLLSPFASLFSLLFLLPFFFRLIARFCIGLARPVQQLCAFCKALFDLHVITPSTIQKQQLQLTYASTLVPAEALRTKSPHILL